MRHLPGYISSFGYRITPLFGNLPGRHRTKVVRCEGWLGSLRAKRMRVIGAGNWHPYRAIALEIAPVPEVEEVHRLVQLLPFGVRSVLESHPNLLLLVEVVMDLGRPPLARFEENGCVTDFRLSDSPLTAEDIIAVCLAVGDFGGDNRAGIDGTLHRISAIRNRSGRVIGLTCRVGRAIPGSADLLADLVREGKSILLLGPPGVGKTTAIREISRMLADECLKRVVIVDTSNEIGGDGDIPHTGIGRARRMQVQLPELQHKVMIEAVENHMPETIIIDEIGTEQEAMACRTIAQRGVQLVGTAHGNELESLMKNPSLNDLLGGIDSVTLGDDEARRRGVQKSVLERQAPATFDVAVEMRSRTQWRVHLDVGHAVDQVLAGYEAGAEVREKGMDGQIFCWPEEGSTDYDSDADELSVPIAGFRKSRLQPSSLNVETQPFPSRALQAARTQETASFVPSNKKEPKRKPRTLAGKMSLRLHCFGVESADIETCAGLANFSNAITCVDRIQESDAIIATRSKVKASPWVKDAAKTAKIPLFTVQSDSPAHLTKALKILVGIDSSPRSVLPAHMGSSPHSDVFSSIPDNRRNKSPVEDSPQLQDAIEECRLAIENVVIPLTLPVELLPREASILEAQVNIVEKYHLPFELVGSAADFMRLRVLPAGQLPGQEAAGSFAADKQTKSKYW